MIQPPSPYPPIGRPKIEDDYLPVVEKNIKLPVNSVKWFGEAAEAQGLTWHNAAREALLQWAKDHHPEK